jgi:hypothetical protein
MSDNNTTKNIDALAIRGLPAPISNNTRGPVRASRYGELFAIPLNKWRHASADEGTYFIAHNATNDAATTLAGHAAPVLADADATMTKPFVHIINNAPSTSGARAYLDYIEIEVITAGANGTADSWATQLDTGATRVTSAGTSLTVLNPNMQSTATPTCVPTGGVITTGAESQNVRNLGFGQFRPSIQVAGDKYMFVFGADPETAGAASVSAAASVRLHIVNLPPVILGPSDQFLLALYSPSQSAAGVYKLRMGWMER